MSMWVQVVYLEVILGRRSEGVGERDRKGGSVSAGTLWMWMWMRAAGTPSYWKHSEEPFRMFRTNLSKKQETGTFIT